MNAIATVLVAALAIVTLVVVVVGFHELGHFTFGKLFGIRVDEFSIGFGKKLFSKQRGETEYAIRAIPLGGYVRMAGMLAHPKEADAGERNFYRASVPKRIVTLLAGVVFNLILAGIIYMFAFMLPSPSAIIAGAPAEKAGLQNGDLLVAIGGYQIDHSNINTVTTTVRKAVNSTGGRPTQIVYTRNGNRMVATVTPQLGLINNVIRPSPCDGSVVPIGGDLITAIDGNPVPISDPVADIKSAHYVDGVALDDPCKNQTFHHRTVPSGLGTIDDATANVQVSWRIGMAPDISGMPLTTAFTQGWGMVPRFFSDEYYGLKELFTNPNSGGPLGANGFQGPVGIGAASVSAAQSGLQSYLMFVALISLNLAFVNIIPIPFLDGGKVVIVAVEGVRRRRLDPKRELALYAAGAAFLIIFTLYVTIGEIHRGLH